MRRWEVDACPAEVDARFDGVDPWDAVDREVGCWDAELWGGR